MGLLSKIFDTDKLEYILREEEEFNVTAPQSWNVETLTVGDTITPDMFKDQYRFYDFDLYIKEIGYDDEYEHDDIEGSHYVTTEFDNSAKKYLHNQHTWWFHEINDYLKPEYKVVTTDLNESEDEFTVDAPEDWNVEMLTVGDTIEPNMWIPLKDLRKQLSSETREYVKYFQSEPRVIKKTFYDNDDQRLYFYIEDSDAEWTNNLLKPQYKVTEGLKESDDDFNVTAPKEWNIQILYDGDLITPDMWNREKLVLKNYIYDPNQDWTIIAEEDPNYVILNSKGGVKIGFTKDTVNSLLKPEYKISLPNLNESDEFNVTAPQSWNIEMLTVGDTITPDMFKDQYRFYDFDLYIKEIGYDDEYEHDDIEGSHYVTTEFDNSAKKYLHNQHTWWFHEINDYLKPEYKVVTPNLSESEDEFTVDAPEDWNIEQLSVGDTIDKNMWDRKKTMGLLHTDIEFNETYKISKIQDLGDWWDVDQEGFDIYEVELVDSQGEEVIDYLDNINTWLKPEFKVVNKKDLFEEEDFNVNAPEDWNVTELGVGDIITSNMFKIIGDRRHWMDRVKELEILKFSNFGVTGIVHLSLPNQNEIYVSWVVDNVNKDLKSNYRIALPLHESDDEDWTVDEPSSEWNVEMLTVGDTITPDMLKPNNEIHDSQENLYITKSKRTL